LSHPDVCLERSKAALTSEASPQHCFSRPTTTNLLSRKRQTHDRTTSLPAIKIVEDFFLVLILDSEKNNLFYYRGTLLFLKRGLDFYVFSSEKNYKFICTVGAA
jgi:hypothetical protein